MAMAACMRQLCAKDSLPAAVLHRHGMYHPVLSTFKQRTVMRHTKLTSFMVSARCSGPSTVPALYRPFSTTNARWGKTVDITLKADPTKPLADSAFIEQKWLQRWKDNKAARKVRAEQPALGKDNGKEREKFYVLSMFPYPSGVLHMGHVRVYTISDALARTRGMMGYDVIHPMGWDAFGLPAENAAIERSIHPSEWTTKNIAIMKGQMEKILADFDWERELATCDPEYYRWTQYLFLKLHEAGLAYQKEAVVNWDPVDETVLANEQVDAEGKSWRSGAIVEKRKLRQWFFKITDYAEDLLQDLDRLQHWPDRVKQMQRNWIGKSKGAEFDFAIQGLSPQQQQGTQDSKVTVFTSRPDTLFGVQFLAVASDHDILKHVPNDYKQQLEAFQESLKRGGTAADSTGGETRPEGVPTGLYADHPLIPNQKIPIYAVNYVVSDYGTGAVMGVPGHDERDYNFAVSKGIEVRHVVVSEDGSSSAEDNSKNNNGAFTARGVLTGDCQEFSFMKSQEAGEAIVKKASDMGFGRAKTSYRIRDWLLSRQRYWGAPIPIIHCDGCGPVPVPTEDLPVALPMDVSFTGRGGSPLKQLDSWVKCSCPKCGSQARRDTDTMDTFVDSSWYFLRYLDPKNTQLPFAPSKATRGMPVDIYIGGVEHAILHLLYSRFLSKFAWKTGMYGEGPEKEDADGKAPGRGEPFKVLVTQGMVQGKTYKDPKTGAFLLPSEVDLTDPNNPIQISTGLPPLQSYEKMSKSKYNGVDPEKMIANYGADATRLHILYKAPPSEELEWDEQSIVGMQRFLAKVWRLVGQAASASPSATGVSEGDMVAEFMNRQNAMNKDERELWRTVNFTVKELTTSLQTTYAFNTSIAFLIKLSNQLSSLNPSATATSGDASVTKGKKQKQQNSAIVAPDLYRYSVESLVKMLAPLAPAFGEECWEALHLPSEAENSDKKAVVAHSTAPVSWPSVFEQAWPSYDEGALKQDKQVCGIQVNGKSRFTIEFEADELPADSDRASQEAFLKKLIYQHERATKWLMDDQGVAKPVKKMIVVKGGKLVNFVL
ncbi:hypothetical protein BGW41_004307 [Actinomortierella wolfii]|nr:hypothetical protein BGW41_004307 [Actinomortierella wolfii]